MKILMLGWELPPYNSGGLGVACFYMAKALSEQGANIDFVLPYKNRHSEIDFMNVIHATDYSFENFNGCGAYDSSNYYKTHTSEKVAPDIYSIQEDYKKFIKRFLAHKENWPDVIHAHDWLTMEIGLFAKKITGAPLISHIHATEFDRAGGQAGNKIVHDIEYRGILGSDKVFAVSKNTRQVILEKYKITPQKVSVVYNAIEPKAFGSPEDYDTQTYKYLEFLKSQGYTVLMTLTRFTAQKGLSYLMRSVALAAQKNPKIALLLVGDGEQRNELIAMAASYGISDKIFFTGFLRGKKWRDSYGVADVFVMSSINEPFGLTALEAAHFNNALILSKQSGVSEILKNILTYDFWDTQKLASHILAVSTSPKLLHDLQVGVKKEYTRISWSQIAEQIMDEFMTLARSKK